MSVIPDQQVLPSLEDYMNTGEVKTIFDYGILYNPEELKYLPILAGAVVFGTTVIISNFLEKRRKR